MFQKVLALFKIRPKKSFFPQLEMALENLDNLPEPIIPSEYILRTYQPGDEFAWCEIMEDNIGRNWTIEICRNKIIKDPRFQPKNFIFITHQGNPIASACAWRKNLQEQVVGEIHMVAVKKNHRGKGLGHLLNAAVLTQLKILGFQKAHLKTDDWRLPAIKSYLKAGFHPLHTHQSHPERWKAIFDKITENSGS